MCDSYDKTMESDSCAMHDHAESFASCMHINHRQQSESVTFAMTHVIRCPLGHRMLLPHPVLSDCEWKATNV